MRRPPRATDRVLQFMVKAGRPVGCSEVGAAVWPGKVGAAVWPGKRNGRVCAVQGGGDYAAQMLLGRMKRAGLVQHAHSVGSSLWEMTWKGIKRASNRENW